MPIETAPFAWTPHRFAGGALALDVANSIILRDDPFRRRDRFADPAALSAFPAAANALCGEREGLPLLHPVPQAAQAAFLLLRETIDAHFRARIHGHGDDRLLADLLVAAAAVLRDGQRGRLDTETAHSALRLIADPAPERLKICPNCGWLFLDRSRNRSRAWCDMAVCGNRAKAKRHYRRQKEEVVQ
ncbi:CGNR zinc finger domain-containing protein [Rhizobium sp. SG2393]|uniref:CGNR zinc finger domain-containing protein n=1 Tax=Rhizobium sp. SG2393 TaxID=3276279 RepID=UPI00366DF472